MTVALAPLVRQLFLNPSNGAPASGFKLFTYQAGTTTKQATYTSSAGMTPNTNPIILDSLGECDLWLTPGIAYKFVFAPPTDTDPPTNAIWTRDNIIETYFASGTLSFPTTTDLLANFPVQFILPDGTLATTAGRTAEGDGGWGTFYYDASDNSTPDNGGTIRVDSAGRRWKWIGPVVTAELFGTGGAAIQAAVTYILASGKPTQPLALTAANYVLTQPIVVSGSQHPQIYGLGLYGTTIQFATTTEQPAFSFAGTEQYSGGSLTGVLITDPTNSTSTTGLIALQISATVGFVADIASGTAKRGVLWLNGASSYTEFCTVRLQSPTNTLTAAEYRTTGNSSFHGSGLTAGTTINATVGNPAVLISAGALPYGSPLAAQIFTNGTGDVTIIQNNSAELVPWFTGDLEVERVNTGVVALAGGVENVYYAGFIGFFGDQSQLFYSGLLPIDRMANAVAGAPVTVFRPVNNKTTSSAAFFQFDYPDGVNQYTVMIDVSGTNYHYIYYYLATTDEASGYTGTQLANPTSNNTAGYGPPVLTWNATNLQVTNSGWSGHSITVGVTFNQVGQGIAHHDQ